MTSRPALPSPGWLLLWRAWKGNRLWRACLLATIAWLLVPERPIAVPGRQGVQSVLWPLVPTLTAMVLPSCLAHAYRDLELAAAKSHARQRGLFAVFALALTAIPCVSGLRFDLGVALRNAALLSGLAFASTVIFPPRVAWMPPSFLPIITWLLGLKLGGVPRPWAVLMQSGSSLPALLAAGTSLGAGLVLFVVPRVPLWRWSRDES